MIPVLGVPILTRPELLQKMLESIDEEVEKLIIVDNGNVIPQHQDKRMHVIRPGYNMGVAASWNTIIKAAPSAPWWAIAGFDVVFGPGDLARLAERMESGMGICLLGGFSAFGISREAIAKAGWFDENYIPAYFEDNDMDYRCRLTGVSMEAVPTGMKHQVSSTIRSDKSYFRENTRTFRENAEYFIAKWGGAAYRETYTTPFDQGGSPRDWTLDLDRLARLSWRTR